MMVKSFSPWSEIRTSKMNFHPALKEIDSWIEHIGVKVVKKEYEQGKVFEESILHSTVYYHLRKIIDYYKRRRNRLFLYSEMPFLTTRDGEGKRSPRVDLAIVILDEDDETPIDLLAVIEVKHYDAHANSIGIEKDLDHLKALRKGIYYPYSKFPRKLFSKKAYFLYIVDEGQILFDSGLKRKINRLKQGKYLKVFLGEGERGEFHQYCQN